MQLQQLVYFLAVARTRHFTRAAESTHVAQPSLSKQIHCLERELGSELFHRARGNVTLTPAGEVLVPFAKRILADVETARLQVHELAELRRGRLRLGATPSLCTGPFAHALALFRGHYPGIQLLIDESGSVEGCQVLVTSGAAIVDSTACDVIKQKAKFTPARDSQGKSIRSVWTTGPVGWNIADNAFDGGCIKVSSDTRTLVNMCQLPPGQEPRSQMMGTAPLAPPPSASSPTPGK